VIVDFGKDARVCSGKGDFFRGCRLREHRAHSERYEQATEHNCATST
jgi:hypothetical protein